MALIRRLGPEDSLEDLTDLLHRAYAPLAARGLRYLATHQDVDTTARRIEGGECYVAIEHDQLVGTITFHDASHTGGTPWYDRPDVASFQMFAVAPERQRSGVGRDLLRTVESRARETGAAELAADTAEPAHDLIAMYLRWGYRIVGGTDWSVTNYQSVILSKSLAHV